MTGNGVHREALERWERRLSECSKVAKSLPSDPWEGEEAEAVGWVVVGTTQVGRTWGRGKGTEEVEGGGGSRGTQR